MKNGGGAKLGLKWFFDSGEYSILRHTAMEDRQFAATP